MITPIEFWVAGEPKGQPRARAFAMKGKGVRMYDPGTAEGWKGLVALAAKSVLPATPLDGPLRVDLTFFFPRPKSHYRSNGQLKPGSPKWHTKKPDRDNSDKAVLDAMTAMRFWVDDCLACDGRIRKLYDDGRGPGVHIRITEANPE